MPVDLAALPPHPILQHAVDPTVYDGAWVRGDAVVVHGPRHTIVLGPRDDVGPLVAAHAGDLRSEQLTVEEQAVVAVRETWSWEVRGHWRWMMTTTLPPAPTCPVHEVGDATEIEALLDAAHPTSFARPGMPGIETWLGVRVDGRLVGVGAIRRDPDGSGHLRAVSVLPELTGRGLGGALSAALTRRAMDRPPHVATLGVYADNLAALQIYDRLAYRTRHTFLSGPVLP